MSIQEQVAERFRQNGNCVWLAEEIAISEDTAWWTYQIVGFFKFGEGDEDASTWLDQGGQVTKAEFKHLPEEGLVRRQLTKIYKIDPMESQLLVRRPYGR